MSSAGICALAAARQRGSAGSAARSVGRSAVMISHRACVNAFVADWYDRLACYLPLLNLQLVPDVGMKMVRCCCGGDPSCDNVYFSAVFTF